VKAACGQHESIFIRPRWFKECQRFDRLRHLQVAHLHKGCLALCATARMNPTLEVALELKECFKHPIPARPPVPWRPCCAHAEACHRAS
jgi:hypothetical protein